MSGYNEQAAEWQQEGRYPTSGKILVNAETQETFYVDDDFSNHPQSGFWVDTNTGEVWDMGGVTHPYVETTVIPPTPPPNLPSVPELHLQRFPEPTDVPLSAQQQQYLDLLGTPEYEALLSTEPNLELLETQVLTPARRELTEQVLPQIADSYSAGPYGSGYHTGAKDAAVGEAVNQFSEASLQARAAESARAQEQALPNLAASMSIADIERQNEIANLNRQIEVHYANQGLTQMEYQADLAAIEMELMESQLKYDYEIAKINMLNQAQQQAELEEAQMLNLIFGVTGAAIGGFMGDNPMDMMAGFSAGQAVGSALSGYPGISLQHAQQGISNYMMSEMISDLALQADPSRLDMSKSGSGSPMFKSPYSSPAPLPPLSPYDYQQGSYTNAPPVPPIVVPPSNAYEPNTVLNPRS